MANSLMDLTIVYVYLQGLPWLSVTEEPLPHTYSYLKYKFLDKVPFDPHDNITTMHMKKRAFDRYKFQSG